MVKITFTESNLWLMSSQKEVSVTTGFVFAQGK